MSFNGSGSFLINTAGQPVVSGTVISSTAFNALTADLATGLSTCITKDGQTTVIANIPMAGYKFTGLGTGSASGDSPNLSQVQSTVVKLLASVSGSDTITAVGSPTVAAYAAGQMFYFVAAGTNTGAVTLNIDALGAKAITRDGSTALIAGDIQSGEVCVVIYDGTRFQLINAANAFGDLSAATLTVSGNTYLATSSGNVGIGTSSPSSFVGYTTVSVNNTTNGGIYNILVNGTETARLQAYSGVFSVAAKGASTNLTFETNGSERARIDTSGNLGIGTSSPGKKLDVVGTIRAAVDSGSAAAIDLTYSSSTRTIHSLETGGGNARPLRILAQSLTYADDSATRLTIDSSGNLGIGTATINYRVVADCADAGNNDNGFAVRNNNSSAYGGSYNFEHRVTGGGSIVRASYISSEGGSGNSFMRFATTIGGTLEERARITSGGDWLVGTTSSADNANVGLKAIYSATAPYHATVGSASTDGTVAYTLYSTGAAAFRFYVGYGGTVYATNTTISAISDQRYKENIRDLDVGLNAILALKPRKFDWKEGKGKDKKDDRGFIAQEFEQVFPDLVDEWKDPAPEGEEPYKSVRQDLIPVLVKAIQELKAELDATKAKVAALEGA